MQIQEFDNNITSVEVTKTYVDFLKAAIDSDQVDLFTLPAGGLLVSLDVNIDKSFAVNMNFAKLDITDDLFVGLDISNPNSGRSEDYAKRNLATTPYQHSPTADRDIQAQVKCRWLGTWGVESGMNTARHALAGAGTQSAALSFGGYNGSYSATTEEYFSNAGNAYTQQLTAGALTFKAKYIGYES